jgi:hypothetical protein
MQLDVMAHLEVSLWHCCGVRSAVLYWLAFISFELFDLMHRGGVARDGWFDVASDKVAHMVLHVLECVYACMLLPADLQRCAVVVLSWADSVSHAPLTKADQQHGEVVTLGSVAAM